MDKKHKKITEILQNTSQLLGLQDDQLDIDIEDDRINLHFTIPQDQSGRFIGRSGQTIRSLRLILGLILHQRFDNWFHLRVNVNDYQDRRKQMLMDKVEQAANRAIDTGQEIIVPDLNSYQRHLVHEHFSNRQDITTESRGQKPLRQLYIIPA